MTPSQVRTAMANSRAISMMYLWQSGMSQREIADHYGVTQGRVNQLIQRARKLPRPELDDVQSQDFRLSFNEMHVLLPMLGFLKEVANG